MHRLRAINSSGDDDDDDDVGVARGRFRPRAAEVAEQHTLCSLPNIGRRAGAPTLVEEMKAETKPSVDLPTVDSGNALWPLQSRAAGQNNLMNINMPNNNNNERTYTRPQPLEEMPMRSNTTTTHDGVEHSPLPAATLAPQRDSRQQQQQTMSVRPPTHDASFSSTSLPSSAVDDGKPLATPPCVPSNNNNNNINHIHHEEEGDGSHVQSFSPHKSPDTTPPLVPHHVDADDGTSTHSSTSSAPHPPTTTSPAQPTTLAPPLQRSRSNSSSSFAYSSVASEPQYSRHDAPPEVYAQQQQQQQRAPHGNAQDASSQEPKTSPPMKQQHDSLNFSSSTTESSASHHVVADAASHLHTANNVHLPQEPSIRDISSEVDSGRYASSSSSTRKSVRNTNTPEHQQPNAHHEVRRSSSSSSSSSRHEHYVASSTRPQNDPPVDERVLVDDDGDGVSSQPHMQELVVEVPPLALKPFFAAESAEVSGSSRGISHEHTLIRGDKHDDVLRTEESSLRRYHESGSSLRIRSANKESSEDDIPTPDPLTHVAEPTPQQPPLPSSSSSSSSFANHRDDTISPHDEPHSAHWTDVRGTPMDMKMAEDAFPQTREMQQPHHEHAATTDAYHVRNTNDGDDDGYDDDFDAEVDPLTQRKPSMHSSTNSTARNSSVGMLEKKTDEATAQHVDADEDNGAPTKDEHKEVMRSAEVAPMTQKASDRFSSFVSSSFNMDDDGVLNVDDAHHKVEDAHHVVEMSALPNVPTKQDTEDLQNANTAHESDDDDEDNDDGDGYDDDFDVDIDPPAQRKASSIHSSNSATNKAANEVAKPDESATQHVGDDHHHSHTNSCASNDNEEERITPIHNDAMIAITQQTSEHIASSASSSTHKDVDHDDGLEVKVDDTHHVHEAHRKQKHNKHDATHENTQDDLRSARRTRKNGASGDPHRRTPDEAHSSLVVPKSIVRAQPPSLVASPTNATQHPLPSLIPLKLTRTASSDALGGDAGALTGAAPSSSTASDAGGPSFANSSHLVPTHRSSANSSMHQPVTSSPTDLPSSPNLSSERKHSSSIYTIRLASIEPLTHPSQISNNASTQRTHRHRDKQHTSKPTTTPTTTSVPASPPRSLAEQDSRASMHHSTTSSQSIYSVRLPAISPLEATTPTFPSPGTFPVDEEEDAAPTTTSQRHDSPQPLPDAAEHSNHDENSEMEDSRGPTALDPMMATQAPPATADVASPPPPPPPPDVAPAPPAPVPQRMRRVELEVVETMDDDDDDDDDDDNEEDASSIQNDVPVPDSPAKTPPHSPTPSPASSAHRTPTRTPPDTCRSACIDTPPQRRSPTPDISSSTLHMSDKDISHNHHNVNDEACAPPHILHPNKPTKPLNWRQRPQQRPSPHKKREAGRSKSSSPERHTPPPSSSPQRTASSGFAQQQGSSPSPRRWRRKAPLRFKRRMNFSFDVRVYHEPYRHTRRRQKTPPRPARRPPIPPPSSPTQSWKKRVPPAKPAMVFGVDEHPLPLHVSAPRRRPARTRSASNKNREVVASQPPRQKRSATHTTHAVPQQPSRRRRGNQPPTHRRGRGGDVSWIATNNFSVATSRQDLAYFWPYLSPYTRRLLLKDTSLTRAEKRRILHMAAPDVDLLVHVGLM